MVLIVISIVYFAYAVLLMGAVRGINIKNLQDCSANNFKAKFSILIPFRNESHNLKQLVDSLNNLNYNFNCFELILINDHSTDNFEHGLQHLNKEFNFQLLQLTNKHGKKNAILKGIDEAKFEYIITIDADCLIPENLLSSYASLIAKKDYDLIIGSVVLSSSNSLIEKFQFLDFLAMQGVGLGWAKIHQAFLCSGANLCYKKSVFKELDPFKNNLSIASGDDLFTLMAFKKNKAKIGTNLDAVVIAKSQPTLKSLFAQRRRWLSKNSSIKDVFFNITAILVFLCNFSLIILSICSFIDLAYLEFLFVFFVIKFILDYFLLYQISYRLNTVICWRNVLKMSFLYPFLLVFIFLSNFIQLNEWKNRKI